jgi:hypothetical protein
MISRHGASPNMTQAADRIIASQTVRGITLARSNKGLAETSKMGRTIMSIDPR